MPETPSGLPPGSRLGPYEIVSALGAGGMGVVYRARDPRLGRDVAIKVLSPELSGTAHARIRLEREARAVAALQHPNICTIYDVGDLPDGHLFLVMELLSGDTLQQRLRNGCVPVAEAVAIAGAVADALATAHAAGIIHRDIKPANIFLTGHGPKILDFGLAKALGPSPGEEATVTALTADHVIGTAPYMSPEQWRGAVVDARTDVFALGATTYEMLTGTRAFTGATNPEIAAAILHRQPAPARELNPDVPGSISDCVMRAIEKPVEHRHQTAADFRSALLHARSTPGHAVSTPSPRRPRTTLVAGLTAAVVIGAAVTAYRWRPAPPPLTDRDTIVIADFRNSTGDPVFDDTLRQGLVVQLQQSPFLAIVPDGRLRATLGLMARPREAALTGEVAAEVCKRTNSAALLEGSIAPIGTRYVVGLRVTSCTDDELIDGQQEEVDRKEDVLGAVGALAAGFRERSGESLATRQRFDTPIRDATTASLEALKAYSAGRRASERQGTGAAMELYLRAVEIDPQFAMAWAIIGLAYNALGDPVAANEAATRAYRLRDRASERERYSITALYERQVTGNLDRARQTFEAYAATYPRDVDAHGLLSGFSSLGTGHYEQAVQHAAIAVTLDPQFAFGHLNGIGGNLFLDRLDAVESGIKAALAAGVTAGNLHIHRFYLAYLRANREEMATAATTALKQPLSSASMEQSLSLVAARSEQWEEARAAARRGIAHAERAGRSGAAVQHCVMAIWEAFAGHTAEARRAVDAALALSDSRETTYAAAFALMRISDRARAAPLIDSLDRRFPEDTSVRFNYLPTLRALQALHAGDAQRALTALEPARPYELAVPALAFSDYVGWAYALFVRGEAYRALGRRDDAIAEFRRILSHRGLLRADPIGAIVERELRTLTGTKAQ